MSLELSSHVPSAVAPNAHSPLCLSLFNMSHREGGNEVQSEGAKTEVTMGAPLTSLAPSVSTLVVPAPADSVPAATVPLLPSPPHGVNASKPVAAGTLNESPASPCLAPSAAPSNVAAPSAPLQVSSVKGVPKKRVVKTNGGDLWLKQIEKARAPPKPYPKLKVPFNLSTPEILTHICHYITGDEVIQLYLTGDKALQHRISISLEEWHFERQKPAPYSGPPSKHVWPALIGSIGHIRHVSYTHYRQKIERDMLSRYPVVPGGAFPVNVRSLKLECGVSADMVRGLRELVNLDDLSLGPEGVFSGPAELSFADLPPNLTFLHCTLPMSMPDEIARGDGVTESMREKVPCFEYLRHVSLPNDLVMNAQFVRLLHPDVEVLHLQRNTRLQGEIIMELPPGLHTLSLCFEVNPVGDFLPHLPATLHTLALHGYKTVGLSNAVFAKLPKTITSLRLPKSSLQLELFAGQWPLPNLLSLDLRGPNSGIVLCDLPRTLESLRLEGSFGQDLLALPPCLTRLVLPDVLATDGFMVLVAGFERAQLELFQPPKNAQNLDEKSKDLEETKKTLEELRATATRPAKTLRTLKLPKATSLTSSCLWRLPSTLTSLTMASQFGETNLDSLPPSLTKLVLPGHTMSNYGFASLPRQIRHLEMPTQTAFYFAYTPTLPPTLQFFSFGHSVNNKMPSLKRQYAEMARQEERNKWRHVDAIEQSASHSEQSKNGTT